MTTIPGQQDIATFLGGGYPSPQFVAPQIPGAQALPQLQPQATSGTGAVQGVQSQALQAPQAASFNAQLLNQLSTSNQNSAVNHSYGSGGVKPSYQADPSVYTGMFK